MNYIDLLTPEEKDTLCKIITGREFKELFKNNEREFQKLRKGFRAKSLTEQFALSTAMSNVDKPFIATYINGLVDMWLKEIQKNVEKLEAEGSTHNVALATTMLDSFFVNNVDLYLKLTGKASDMDTCSAILDRMTSIKSERKRNEETANQIRAIEEEKRQLYDQLKEVQQNANTIRTEYERRIQEVEQENSTLTSQLTEAQEKITELQTAPAKITSEDVDYLAQYDDTDATILHAVSNDEIVSLCGVISDYNGQKWLMRYADLSNNGHYHVFHKREDTPSYFTNRDKIFYKDGPSNDGFYGIWTWSAIPSEKDPSKDYIISRYKPDLNAIEVAVITNTSDLDSLVNQLKSGIEYIPHSRRIMFSFCSSKGMYTGILCNCDELNSINGKISFSEGCAVVPIYVFPSDNIMRLDNGLSFYKNAFAGTPDKLYHLKTPLEIVKSIVTSSISWPTYKTRGIIRADYRTFKDFLCAIPVDDITRQIETACHCSSPAAKALLEEFLSTAKKYVDGNSLEDDIILSAISASAELQERAKTLIRADWETENKGLLADAQEKLKALDGKINDATTQLAEAQEELNKTKLEEDRLTGVIAEKEKLAEDVEKAVSERIQQARKHAADFIANMAFVTGQQIQLSVDVDSAANKVASDPVVAQYQVFSPYEELSDLEAHHSWADVIDTATFEFGEAGVTEQYRRGLAAFLCAAFIEKQPIFLVGPNSLDIVQAFCASVSAHKYGLLCCEGNYDNKVTSRIGATGEDIVIINNLLSSRWMNRLPEIVFNKDIFYVATHPYAEDIQVEPQSLYGFVLPLFTEFFVDKTATGKYYGGYFADDFKPYSAPKGIHKEPKVLSSLSISSFVKNRINNLVTTMHGIYPSTTADDEFLFSVFPIAYASLEVEKLVDAVADPQKGFTISANLKRDLRHVMGDV